MQGGMDQRSHVVCQDLIDTSVSSHLARIAEHGAGLLGCCGGKRSVEVHGPVCVVSVLLQGLQPGTALPCIVTGER